MTPFQWPLGSSGALVAEGPGCGIADWVGAAHALSGADALKEVVLVEALPVAWPADQLDPEAGVHVEP
ncbi:hypothetical protein ACQPXM_06460 [Kribbella sp. CA-253562]|uniref:hypothetical protein n=1 Tax=Kribbella sp. CA-253562 TaxID=3239942 RepID=UPI003D8BB5C8